MPIFDYDSSRTKQICETKYDQLIDCLITEFHSGCPKNFKHSWMRAKKPSREHRHSGRVVHQCNGFKEFRVKPSKT